MERFGIEIVPNKTCPLESCFAPRVIWCGTYGLCSLLEPVRRSAGSAGFPRGSDPRAAALSPPWQTSAAGDVHGRDAVQETMPLLHT